MNDEAKDKKRKNPLSGIALAFTFLIISLILFLIPDFFKSIIATRIVMFIFAVIGICGLGFELNKIKKIGFDNLGVGISLGIIGVIIYYFSPIWWLNIVAFVLFFFSTYGILLGLISILKIIIFSEISLKKELIKKILIFLGQIFGISLVILQILKLLKIL